MSSKNAIETFNSNDLSQPNSRWNGGEAAELDYAIYIHVLAYYWKDMHSLKKFTYKFQPVRSINFKINERRVFPLKVDTSQRFTSLNVINSYI